MLLYKNQRQQTEHT